MTNPIPPQRFYNVYIKTSIGPRYLSMVQAVGPNQAKQRAIADWKNAAPQMVQDIQSGKSTLVVKATKIKKAARILPIQTEPKKAGFFNAFGQKVKVRMEIGNDRHKQHIASNTTRKSSRWT